MTAEDLARLFHEEYERLAPDFGYSTREASAVPWEDVPDDNKSLMLAVAANVLAVVGRWPGEEPRYIIRESSGYDMTSSQKRTEIMILDRVYCHKVVWSNFRDPSMTRVPLHKQRAHAYLRLAMMEREYA